MPEITDANLQHYLEYFPTIDDQLSQLAAQLHMGKPIHIEFEPGDMTRYPLTIIPSHGMVLALSAFDMKLDGSPGEKYMNVETPDLTHVPYWKYFCGLSSCNGVGTIWQPFSPSAIHITDVWEGLGTEYAYTVSAVWTVLQLLLNHTSSAEHVRSLEEILGDAEQSMNAYRQGLTA